MDKYLGQIVISEAGRDKGRKFIIVEIFDDFNVFIADGDLRRIEKPKKKKIKHLVFTREIAEALSEKLDNKIKVYNVELRKALIDLDNT